MKKVCFLLILVFGFSVQSQNKLEKFLLKSDDSILNHVMENAEKYEVQILYTSVKSSEKGNVGFQEYSFRLEDSTYFYPASTVKLPLAVLALEKLNSMSGSIDRNTTYFIEGDSLPHTIAGDIKQIFAVSDNEAYNRLFEFLGQDYINSTLKEKGLEPVRISNRFAGDRSLDLVTRQMLFKTRSREIQLPVTHNKKAEA